MVNLTSILISNDSNHGASNMITTKQTFLSVLIESDTKLAQMR